MRHKAYTSLLFNHKLGSINRDRKRCMYLKVKNYV